MKKGWNNKVYISLIILYRFGLSFYIGYNNEKDLNTLIVLTFEMFIIFYFCINFPFCEALQNYRSILCHFVSLVILLCVFSSRNILHDVESASNVMKNNRFAVIEIYSIAFCVVVSGGCIGYEIFKKLKRFFKKGQKRLLDESERQKFESTYFTDIFESTKTG